VGEVVAAILTAHVPRLMIFDLEARRAYMGNHISTFYDAMAQVEREMLAPLDFDTFVILDTHWFTTIEYVINAHERLAGIYTSEELPNMLHDYEYDYRGDPTLAAAIAETAKANGVRALAADHRNLPVHYPTLNVMHYFNPRRDRRVVSIGVCQTAGIHNDLAFGKAIGDAIARNDRRVVLIASGGLSHHFWEYDRILERASASADDIYSDVHRNYDLRIIEWLKAGRHDQVLEAAPDYRRQCSPEGHFSHYLMMAGAMGADQWRWHGRQFGDYEAALGTGQAILYFTP